MLPFLTFKIRADPSREEISPWHFWHSSANLGVCRHPAAKLGFVGAGLEAPW